MPRPSNRDLLLDTAERLFAAEGVDRVSLRSVCAEAGLNAAAANYYFGTKEDLVEAIVLRRMPTIMGRRVEILDALAAADSPDVADVVEALVTPLAELLDREGERGRAYIRFVARLLLDHSPTLARITAVEFGRGIDLIASRLRAALPDMSRETLAVRSQLAFTTIFQALGDPQVTPTEASLADLVDFIAGGLRAPARARTATEEC